MSSQFIPAEQFSKFNDEEKLLVLEAEAMYRERTKISHLDLDAVLSVLDKYTKWRRRDSDTPALDMPSPSDIGVALDVSMHMVARELELSKPVDGPWLNMVGFTYVPDMVDGNILDNYEAYINHCLVEVRLTELNGIMVTLKSEDNYIDMKAPNRGCIDSLIKMLS